MKIYLFFIDGHCYKFKSLYKNNLGYYLRALIFVCRFCAFQSFSRGSRNFRQGGGGVVKLSENFDMQKKRGEKRRAEVVLSLLQKYG